MKLEFPSPKPKVGPQTCSREGRRPQSRGWPAMGLESRDGVSEGSEQTSLWLGGFGQWLCLATGPVAVVGVLEEVPAGDVGMEAGTGQESPRQLSVQGIGLFRRWAKPVLQQYRDEALHAAGSIARSKVVGALGGEGLPQDHHGLHVGVRECLGVGETRGNQCGHTALHYPRVSSINTSPQLLRE